MKVSPAKPKDVQGRVVIVDAANVAIDDATGQASIRRLKLLEAALGATGCSQVIFIADARLRHRLGPADLEQFKSMIESRELYQAPAGTSADEFVIDLAKRKDGFMVSNDRYREHLGRWTQLQSRLVKFLIVEDEVFLSGIDAELTHDEATGTEGPDDSITSVIQGRTSSWFDVFVTLPFVSLFGGFITAVVWILALAAIFAPVYAFGTSALGLTLFGVAVAVAGSVAILLTLLLARRFIQDDSVSGTNANEVHLRAYAAVALLMWILGLAFLLLSVAFDTAWPLAIGLILSTGPAFPLIGFIRATKMFRDFVSWLDTALVAAVCVVALAWLAVDLGYAFFVVSSDAEGTDKALVVIVSALLAIQAVIVLARWATPLPGATLPDRQRPFLP